MAITDWPAAERPREKLLHRGPQALSDAELLAIFLRTGLPGRTAVDLAREVLAEYGGLRALLEADRAGFCRTKGLGAAKYAQLQAVLEMGRRHLYETLQRGDCLGSPADTRRYLLARLRDYPHEVFACLFLDNRHRVIDFSELFRGTIDGTSVHPREVVKQALARNAAAVIAQKHPSNIKPFPQNIFSSEGSRKYPQIYPLDCEKRAPLARRRAGHRHGIARHGARGLGRRSADGHGPRLPRGAATPLATHSLDARTRAHPPKISIRPQRLTSDSRS